MKPAQLVVGDSYFMVTYPEATEATMGTPIILTYRFLGKDPEGIQPEEPGSHYYFRYLPAFQYDEHGDEGQSFKNSWEVAFPGAFSGWGESVPTCFSEEKVLGLNTLANLIEVLAAIRPRSNPNEPTE